MIICDEPVSALDVSIQAQVVNLLKSPAKEMGLSLIFIAHDLSRGQTHLRSGAGDVPGQRGGAGTGKEIFANPLHPIPRR